MGVVVRVGLVVGCRGLSAGWRWNVRRNCGSSRFLTITVLCVRGGCRAVAEAAATVRGAENFSLKSRGKKKSKKAKFKSLAEGSLMSDTEENSVGEEGGGDPSYRDGEFEMLGLPHRSPSQRKRKAPKLLEEEMSAERQLKKSKKDQVVREKGAAGDKVVSETGGAMVWGGEGSGSVSWGVGT